MSRTDVTAELSEDDDGVFVLKVKISMGAYELNVRIPREEVTRLREVPDIAWENGTLRLGEAAGASVFWCAGEPGQISIMIGHDDQTWDIGLSFPASIIEQILKEADTAERYFRGH